MFPKYGTDTRHSPPFLIMQRFLLERRERERGSERATEEKVSTSSIFFYGAAGGGGGAPRQVLFAFRKSLQAEKMQ